MTSGKNDPAVPAEVAADRRSKSNPSPTGLPEATCFSAHTDPLLHRIGHLHFILAGLLENIRGGFGSLIGVSSFQYVLIELLATRRETQWTVRSVAREMHVTDAYVSTEIAALVRAGLISKTGNPSDRRVSFLALTDRGQRSLAGIAPVQASINTALFVWLDPTQATAYADDLATFIGEAERAIDVLKGTTADHCAAPTEAVSSGPTETSPPQR